MSTTYIETYIFGFGGVTNKRNFSGENNSAGVATTYGNINSAKTDRDNRRQDRVRKEIDGGETVDASTKYYTTQSALDADTSFTGTKLLTNESLHVSGRDLETNTTEVARQTARVAERGTYNASNDTYAGDTGTEKEREDARTLESGTTEVARQAARVAERGTYDASTDTYAGDTGTEKEREDARTLESGTTEVARQAARVAERGTYDASTDTYAGDTGTEKEREDARTLESGTTEVARQTARVAERGTYDANTDTYAGDIGTEKEREDARTLESGTTEVARQAARVAESGTYDATTDTYDSTSPCKEKDRQDYRNRENIDDELTPWDPDNATNANYRTYINFPGNIA
jgi:hypothetical protein